MGQVILKHCIRLVEENGFKVLYGDTDSIFVQAKKETITEIIEESKILQDKIWLF